MEGYSAKFGVNQLELALGKLYKDPFVIYREYIQNACDGIELAMRKGLLNKGEAVVSIQISKNEITIRDRGVGVSIGEIGPRLVDIGNSTKYKDDLAGKYGIGRLIAAQYCDMIIFETSYHGENQKTVLTWNTSEAFRLIESHEFENATEIVDRVTHAEFEKENVEAHYFRVTLKGINRRIEKLVNVDAVKAYVSMMAPVDYSMEFKEDFLMPAFEANPEFKELYQQERIYKVVINESDVRKPYCTAIPDKKVCLTEPLFMKFEDPDYGILGWGWYALNDKIIQMNNLEFRGIRLRKMNTLVGDEKSMGEYMKASVSVNYFVGEIFLTHENIQPTGSRDGLVDTEEKAQFDVLMKAKAEKLKSLYDNASHLGSQTIDKITDAYIKMARLRAKLEEADSTEKKEINSQLKEQKDTIAIKSNECKERIKALEETEEGKVVANAVLEARQKALDKKIDENNAKKSKPKVKKTTITQLIEAKAKAEPPADSVVAKDPKEEFVSKLSKEAKKFYKSFCSVIDNEPALVPSLTESLKLKILKKLAK